MTEQEVLKQAEAFLQFQTGSDPEWERFDPKQFEAAAKRLGVALPATWLRALPHLFEVLASPKLPDDHDCNLELDAERFERSNRNRIKEGTQLFDSKRWVEFGSDCGEGRFCFDLASKAMPADAEVIFWEEGEYDEPKLVWPSVVVFLAEFTSLRGT